MFALGLALIASVINVYFRDTQHLVSIFLLAWLYATPIIYPISMVMRPARGDSTGFSIYQLNPLARFVEAFRDTMYDGHMPEGEPIVYLVA